jgi:hypothetical protein
MRIGCRRSAPGFTTCLTSGLEGEPIILICAGISSEHWVPFWNPSCITLCSALLMATNQEWMGRIYLRMEEEISTATEAPAVAA